MTRTIDPSFSTRPTPQWMTGVQSSLDCYATNDPDGPDGIDGPIEPIPKPAMAGVTEADAFIEYSAEPIPEPAMAGVTEADAFIEYSANIIPPPPSGYITEPKIMHWSQDGTTKEFTGWDCSLYDLHLFSRDEKTGLRKAVKISTKALPLEFSIILDAAGHLDYFLKHVDDITLCPLLIMADVDQSGFLHLSSAAAYVRGESNVERKLFVNINKYVGDDSNEDRVFEARADFEILPDLVDGALRLHVISNVMNRIEPVEHLSLSHIRRQSIPLQISAIDTILDMYNAQSAVTERSYAYLKQLRQELAQELKQL